MEEVVLIRGNGGWEMCEMRSPGGHLVCANPRCNGRSHVWVHESSAPDAKRDNDAHTHVVA